MAGQRGDGGKGEMGKEENQGKRTGLEHGGGSKDSPVLGGGGFHGSDGWKLQQECMPRKAEVRSQRVRILC